MNLHAYTISLTSMEFSLLLLIYRKGLIDLKFDEHEELRVLADERLIGSMEGWYCTTELGEDWLRISLGAVPS